MKISFSHPSKQIAAVMFISLACMFTAFQTNAQDCTCTNCPQFMPDNFMGNFTINVMGAANNQLGQNGQGVCVSRRFRSQTLEGEIKGRLTETITFRSANRADALINRRTVDLTSAGWPPRRDALIRWRALFEPCELVRPSVGLRRHVFVLTRRLPAGPQGGTLLAACGPCLSRASWAALLRVRDPPFP